MNAILPRLDCDDLNKQRIYYNTQLPLIARQHQNTHFIDFTQHFEGERYSLFGGDYLHLSRYGYQLFARYLCKSVSRRLFPQSEGPTVEQQLVKRMLQMKAAGKQLPHNKWQTGCASKVSERFPPPTSHDASKDNFPPASASETRPVANTKHSSPAKHPPAKSKTSHAGTVGITNKGKKKYQKEKSCPSFPDQLDSGFTVVGRYVKALPTCTYKELDTLDRKHNNSITYINLAEHVVHKPITRYSTGLGAVPLPGQSSPYIQHKMGTKRQKRRSEKFKTKRQKRRAKERYVHFLLSLPQLKFRASQG